MSEVCAHVSLYHTLMRSYDSVTQCSNIFYYTGSKSKKSVTAEALARWKFRDLDKNKDGRLSFKETRKFERKIKTPTNTKGCAKGFFKSCDKNRDKKIDKTEWITCLTAEVPKTREFYLVDSFVVHMQHS